VAADAAQEAFVRVLDHPSDRSIERAWLFKVGTNYVMERARTAARRERLLAARPDRAIGDPPRDPHADVEADERRRAVLSALDCLSEKERVSVLMREEGFSHREIADAVGTTTGAVGTLIARAHQRLLRTPGLDLELL